MKESVQLENMNYIDIMSKLNRDKVFFNDRTLVFIVQKYYVQPPCKLPYNLSHPKIRNPSPGQTQFIDEYLNHKQNGFCVDCGAFDGEHLSNSLFLERYRNWTGIIIEPNPTTYGLLRQKHRKAYSLNACLSLNKYPSLERSGIEGGEGAKGGSWVSGGRGVGAWTLEGGDKVFVIIDVALEFLRRNIIAEID
ncbi:uncharacterized protein LOC123559647 [Mercenaria mercenaria]|uniref:uncharacterized protein LOC123559647 n=1 Tax=Mercenaria mercenaria TaxID=6596 RepID=UPI00234F7C95|nr:uncharacterized protein LOC123559647 [Mercenaria mercenaria]